VPPEGEKVPEDPKKLESFITMLVNDARSESDRIRADNRTRLTEAIAEAKLEFAAQAERHIQSGLAQARAESGRAISKKLVDDKQRLFLYRKKLTDELLDDVRRRIEAYARTPEYFIQLGAFLRTAMEQFEYEPVVVYLRPEDIQTMAQIGQALPGSGISIEAGTFVLGGLICECPGRHLMLDMTFDAKFAEISARHSEFEELHT
jgi:vacuolar-type H+-ATPase subunit E/Vma4